MSFCAIPEKYLPDFVKDNVSYYDDGAYQKVHGTYTYRVDPPAGQTLDAVYQFAQVDDDQKEPVATAIRGVRKVRNIQALVNVDALTNGLAGTIVLTCILSVRREGLQLVPSNVLDIKCFQEMIGGSVYSDEIVSLNYFGELNLNSGDYLQISVSCFNVTGSQIQCEGAFSFKYDIKYS